jgi:HEAT repeat protein
MVQQAIILALQEMDDQRAVAALLAVLHTSDEPVLRTAVIKALIILGDQSVVEAVRLFVNDSDHHVRDWAAEAVTRLGGA